MFWVAVVLTAAYLAAAGWILAESALDYTRTNNLPFSAATGMMGLNEWGDFLAGICGPIALIWVVVSVIMQGMELKEQREEMSKQAAAQQAQASYIKMQLAREEQDKCWRDILALLDTFRELVPVGRSDDRNGNEFLTFKANGTAVVFKYTPPSGVEPDNLQTFLFLGRAVGGLRHPAQRISDLIEAGHSIECPKSKYKYERMIRILEIVDEMKDGLPESQKIILDGIRSKDWLRILAIVQTAFNRSEAANSRLLAGE